MQKCHNLLQSFINIYLLRSQEELSIPYLSAFIVVWQAFPWLVPSGATFHFSNSVLLQSNWHFLPCWVVCITLLPHVRDWRLRSTQNTQAAFISRWVKSLALLRCSSFTGAESTSWVEDVSPPFHHVFMYRSWVHFRVISSSRRVKLIGVSSLF